MGVSFRKFFSGGSSSGGSECEGGGGGGGGSRETDDYTWERTLLETRVYKSGHITYAIIVDSATKKIRAVVPPEFVPLEKGMKDIIAALDGQTAGLNERGVNLGGSTPVCQPGKFISGKAIYSSDGKDGGAVVFKTKKCVLIVLYNEGPNTAVRVAQEAAEYMEECDR